MVHGQVPLDEELLVIGIEDGLLDVLAGKALNRSPGLPEAHRDEFGTVIVDPPKLALYTTRAACACHRESETGSLEPGKLADFTVLDKNPLESEPGQIPGIRVLATVLGGTPVYQSSDIFPGR